jgi:uncharacterized protein (DUF58 family)
MNLWNDRSLRLSVTRLGFEYVAALLAVGVFAVNTGNNLLYLIFSLMLALLLVSGIVSRKALQGMKLSALDEGNLFARVRGGIRVRLADAAPKRMRGLELHLEIEGGAVEPGFYAGGSGETEPVVVLNARIEQRGWTRIQRLELRTRYPFGFLEKAWRFALDRPVLILPHPRTPTTRPSNRLGEGTRSLPKPGESSPEGARPLRQGDPPSRVHWKRTAQRRQPWVRTFEEEVPVGVHLKLDLRDWAAGRPFERELERLSGAVLQARLQKREVSLELHGGESMEHIRGHSACWRSLALAQAAGDRDRMPTTMEDAAPV